MIKNAFYSKHAAEINRSMEESFSPGDQSLLNWILYMKNNFLNEKQDISENLCQFVN